MRTDTVTNEREDATTEIEETNEQSEPTHTLQPKNLTEYSLTRYIQRREIIPHARYA